MNVNEPQNEGARSCLPLLHTLVEEREGERRLFVGKTGSSEDNFGKDKCRETSLSSPLTKLEDFPLESANSGRHGGLVEGRAVRGHVALRAPIGACPNAVRRGIVVAAFSNTNPSPVRGDMTRATGPEHAAPDGAPNIIWVPVTTKLSHLRRSGMSVFASPSSLKCAAASVVPRTVKLRESSGKAGGLLAD
jgi:hypothetical protein